MPIMTYKNAVQEILMRVNDADGDVYLQRSKDLIFEGMNILASGGDYIEEDIPGMIKSIMFPNVSNQIIWTPPTDIDFVDDLYGGQVLKLLNITHIQGDGIALSLKRISNEYFDKMNFDSEYDPLSNEVFYVINRLNDGWEYNDPESGNIEPMAFSVYINFSPQDRIESEAVKLQYIRSPNPDSWVYDSDDGSSSTMSGYLSLPFIYKVIDYAAEKIKQEIAGA